MEIFNRLDLWQKWSLTIGGLVVCITGAAKIASSTGSDQVLTTLDPIFGIPYAQLLWIVGIIELIIGGTVFITRRNSVRTYLIGWIAAEIGLYRLGLWWSDYAKPCLCLGTLTGKIHISQDLADVLMLVLLWLLVAIALSNFIILKVKHRNLN